MKGAGRDMLITNMEKKKEILYYFFLIVLTAGVGYISLGKGFDFNIYPNFSGDETFGMALVKSIQENGIMGIFFNNRIGAPETAALIDFPVIGNIMVILLWIISWFVKSTPAILYIYIILSFVLDGLSMSFLLRKIKINRETSFVISVLFACAPYHFYRLLVHSSLINYMFIPIAIYLSLYIIGYIEEKRWKIVLLGIILGLGYGYYYAFGLILMAIAYVIKLIRLEKKKDIIKDLWVAGTVLAIIAASLMPKIIYSIVNGSNIEVGHRAWFEQEIFGLKIINLLLPVSYHRIEALRNLTSEYASKAPLVNENSAASLGIIASIGFIILCISLIISLISDKKNDEKKNHVLINFLSLSTLTFVLTGAIGGFGEIFNWAITSQIRCYNRSSIVISALSLIMMAVLINKIRLRKKIFSYCACTLFLCVGLYDQVNIYNENWQDTIKPTQDMYYEYFKEIESDLPEGAMVYQLPLMIFPEAVGVNNINDYKPFIGYLFTNNLRWSYGAVRGRNNLGQELYIDNGISYAFISQIQEAGFGAVYIDLDGYLDGGEQILAFYNSLGVSPIISGDGKLYTYNISDLQISEGWFIPGYSFVKTWSKSCNVEINDEILVNIAKGLNNRDQEAYQQIYNWSATLNSIVISGTNDEYVNFCYNYILNRQSGQNEHDYWLTRLQNGASRQEVFFGFIDSEEFRNSKGLTGNN